MRDYTQKERAWLWLGEVFGAAVTSADKLLYLNGGLIEAYEAARRSKLIHFPEDMSDERKRSLYKKAEERAIDGVIANMERIGVHAVTRESRNYPSLLREIYDPPTVLYVKGRLPERIPIPIAVIGSRKCSDYGKQMAGYFGRRLAESGACVISGLAVGCDSEAARGALTASEAECPTIAVLGGGVDVIYPTSSKKLYDEIASRGAVISEYRPGTAPTRSSFPQRNRIISGISKGVLVIEAGARSGTRITANCAHDQGRDVFAIPGRISDLMSVGTNGLIKCGEAKAVFDVDDILCEYGSFTLKADSPVKSADTSMLTPEQKTVYDSLLTGEKNADALCFATGFSVAEINIILTEMELSGIIKQLPNGEYSV